MKRPLHHRTSGFTLVEVLIATALLSFSLVVMFGFHAQAVRSNANARKITDCTYLAQSQMEQLMAVSWTGTAGRPASLASGNSGASDWESLYLGMSSGAVTALSGGLPDAVTALDETAMRDSLPAPQYYVTWEVDDMDTVDDTWVRVRVRCTYKDRGFNTWRGTTISAYRYRDG